MLKILHRKKLFPGGNAGPVPMALGSSGSPGWIGAALAILGAVIVLGLRFYRLRYYHEFTDEADNIVTGWLVSEGERLYGSVFSHHFPLAYMATHAVASLSPSDHLAHFRIVPWLACVAVALSLFRRDDRRTWFGPVVFLILASAALPSLEGFMVLSEMLWGAAFAVFSLRVVFPVLLGSGVSRFDAAVGGAALAVVCIGSLTAVYPVAIAMAAMGAAWAADGARRDLVRPFVGAFAVSFAAILGATVGWILLFGSFAGFLDQALVFNFVAYAPFIPESSTPLSLVSTMFASWRADLGLDPLKRAPAGIQFVMTLLAAATAAGAAFAVGWRAWRRPGRVERLVTGVAVPCLVLLVFVFLRMRGTGFRALPLYVMVFAFVSHGLGALWTRGRWKGALAGAVAALTLVAVPASKDEAFLAGFPDHHALAGLDDAAAYIRERTAPSDRIAVFPSNPYIYLESRRKPAVDSVFYFPWQAAWERGNAPLPATCGQFVFRQPRFVYLAPQRIWGYFDWEDYAECVDRAIKRHYRQVEPERFQGHLWERSSPGEVRWAGLRKVEGGQFGWTGPKAADRPGPAAAAPRVTIVDRRGVRRVPVNGWAAEDSGGPCEGRILLVLKKENLEVTLPAARVPGGPDGSAGGAWTGWSSDLYVREFEGGTYDVRARVLRPGQREYLESPSLATLLLR